MPQQMLVHKGGQIKNVQLITGVRIAEMSRLQNCSVMCQVIVKMKKKERKSQGGGVRGCVGLGGTRVDVNREVNL